MQQSVVKASGSRSSKLRKEEEWAAKEVQFMNGKLSELPQSPNCPSLIELYLQGNRELTPIPPLFFKRMARLQVLNLSHTSIKSLPKSLPKLVALKKLLLRGCELFMELSPHVGKLKNLEELDLDQTQIMELPRDIGKLLKLRHLRVSFYPICGKKMSKSNLVIHPDSMSILSQLAELSIDVDPSDKRWDDSVEAVVKEVCNSKRLGTLVLYLPRFQLLDRISSLYPSLSSFRFTVGHHKRRIISRVPHEVEAEFRSRDKSLKFVNGESIPIQIKAALKHSASFFLDQHATATSLSEFGIKNMKRIKFCLLAECYKMETIIDGERQYDQNEDDGLESVPSSVETVLESLEYLSIYYMENLGSMWRGPNGYGCISKLKVLALHTCPRMIHICSPALLGNFVNLEDLILEDCPQLTSLVSPASVKPMMPNTFLPSLKRLLLIYLPELLSISNGLLIAPNLETIGFYNCPKLKSISKLELSSKVLKTIKGERQWWADMNWNEAEWGSRPDHLMLLFSPINNEKDVMTQLTEDHRDLFEATIENEVQQLDNGEERIIGTDETKSIPSDCILSTIPLSKASEQPWWISSEKNKRLEDDYSDAASETGEIDDDEDEPKAKRWNCTENEPKDVVGSASKTVSGDRVAFRTKSDCEELDDGYAWRKYGKKTVKGYSHPRNYYRCSTNGCPVKKRVERDSQDTSFVITTYEGIHNHDSAYVKRFHDWLSPVSLDHRADDMDDAAEATKTISPTKGDGVLSEASVEDKGLHPGGKSAKFVEEAVPNIDAVNESSSHGVPWNKKDFPVDLKLGQVGNTGDESMNKRKEPGKLKISCLVDQCNSDLSNSKAYHRRHKVCELHCKSSRVMVNGQMQRFCQQCSRFHSLVEFDEGKRSCRRRLADHYRRRRKPQSESYIPNSQGTQILPSSLSSPGKLANLSSPIMHLDAPFRYFDGNWKEHGTQTSSADLALNQDRITWPGKN